jgi:hypothetical protein
MHALHFMRVTQSVDKFKQSILFVIRYVIAKIQFIMVHPSVGKLQAKRKTLSVNLGFNAYDQYRKIECDRDNILYYLHELFIITLGRMPFSNM